MVKDKVVVYGLSTEGYYLACQMASKGADVHIIDESSSSAISLKPETAKTYPSVASLQGDEPLLSMKPIQVAISEAQYLFFTPRIRNIGEDFKTEINSKFKDAIGPLKKGSSVVYCIATGFGVNKEKINTIKKFSGLCSVLEICKYVKNNAKSDNTFDEFKDVYLDDMITGLFDLRSLGSSFEGAQTLMYMINGSIKGIAGYIKRLIDTIRLTLKKNDLKASKIKIVLSWTLDTNEMRADKIEMLNNLSSKLRDYIGDVETAEGNVDVFHSDKTTIFVACSITDYKKIREVEDDQDFFVIKANPLCEVENKDKII